MGPTTVPQIQVPGLTVLIPFGEKARHLGADDPQQGPGSYRFGTLYHSHAGNLGC